MRLWMRDLRRAPRRRVGMRAASVLAIVAGALALAGAGGIASADNGGPGTGIDYGSSWAYTSSAPVGAWYAPTFDASSWATGAAPFGNTPGHPSYCPSFPEANTYFQLGSTIYLRKSFTLPANAFGLHVVGTIDNNADVWVNGTHEGASPILSGSCDVGAIDLPVPNSGLNLGGSNLVAVQAVDHGVASYFDLQATYGAIQFANQPVETQKGSPITDGSGPIQVTITDADGNPVSGKAVDISLQNISGSGTISGNTAATDSNGVATFPALEVSAPGEYRLVATSEGATATSDALVIADQVTECPAGQTCTSTGGSTSNTQVTASSSFTSDPALAVSVIDGGAAIPANVCGDFQPLGSGSFINILGGVVGGGNITATWTLAKSLVKQAGNPGAAHFDICLGAENLNDPSGESTTGWTTKDGSPAVPVTDPNLGVTLFWGLLPDCPKHGSPAGPCILHRNKNQGNEVVSFYLPYPWDASFHGG